MSKGFQVKTALIRMKNVCMLAEDMCCNRHNDYYQSLYLPTDGQESCFKRILKFTLKQLLHVSVESPSSGSVLFELAKVIVVKIIC